MRITKCTLSNFGSYRSLTFDFSNLGLALVSGPTGCGKSTLVDGPCWILFGQTSKGGTVDEVRSWDIEEPTSGELEVDLPDGIITVHRCRGKNKNDLYWLEDNLSSVEHRGKDLVETQKLLCMRLGVSAEQYLAGAYHHQFSSSDKFFTAKAKDRRELLELIADLSFPVSLSETAAAAKKETKNLLDKQKSDVARLEGQLQYLAANNVELHSLSNGWQDSRKQAIEQLCQKRDGFESARSSKLDALVGKIEELDKLILPSEDFDARAAQFTQQLSALSQLKIQRDQFFPQVAQQRKRLDSLASEFDKLKALDGKQCPICLSPCDSSEFRLQRLRELGAALMDLEPSVLAYEKDLSEMDTCLSTMESIQKSVYEVSVKKSNNQRYKERSDSLLAELRAVSEQSNVFEDQIKAKSNEINPYTEQLENGKRSWSELNERYYQETDKLNKLNVRLGDLSQIYDLSFVLRGELLKKAVSAVEYATNQYLEKYFNAELRVQFVLEGSDKFEVEITKNGHVCSYLQLSGGQRKLLGLAFSVARMKATSNKAGVHFSMLAFDEPFGGALDSDEMVQKAFNLFQELQTEHESVLVIDHCPDFKGLFSQEFKVQLQGDESTVEDGWH